MHLLLFALVPAVVKRPLRAAEGELKVDENDVRLAELIFSTRDPRIDVARAPELYGDEFCDFVLSKAEKTDDMEERIALKSLVDMVRKIHEQMKPEVKPAKPVFTEEREVVTSTADVLKRANEAVGVPQKVIEEESEVLEGEALATYEKLLNKLLAASDLETEVAANFETCDYSLLNLAASRLPETQRVIDAVNALAAKRLESAADRLQTVVRAGAPEKMMQKISELAARGGIDAPLIELLEANRQQAEKAGAAGEQAALLMGRLAARCRDEMDRRFAENDPEKKLLRALLRCDNPNDREKLIRRAFEVKEAIELDFQGTTSQGGPEVEPPKFIDACLKLIADFGNVDDGSGTPLEDTVKAIADQAEAVAIELFGDVTTPREQQDRMWKDATTSVFDLEAAEMAAEAQGDRMPWQNDKYDDMLPPGFDQAGVKRIGGG